MQFDKHNRKSQNEQPRLCDPGQPRLLVGDVVLYHNPDNDADNDQYDQSDEEADPPLLACGTGRGDGLIGIIQTVLWSTRLPGFCVDESTYPASVSFSTPAA